MSGRLVQLITLLFVALLAGAGCGGGTRGTGIGEGAGSSAVSQRTGSIRGVVLDSTGMPAAGVQITLLENGDSVTTDENGEFELRLPKDNALAPLPSEGSTTATLEVDLGDETVQGVISGDNEKLVVQVDVGRKVIVIIDEEGNESGEVVLTDV
jgi:hypothetical protein